MNDACSRAYIWRAIVVDVSFTITSPLEITTEWTHLCRLKGALGHQRVGNSLVTEASVKGSQMGHYGMVSLWCAS